MPTFQGQIHKHARCINQADTRKEWYSFLWGGDWPKKSSVQEMHFFNCSILLSLCSLGSYAAVDVPIDIRKKGMESTCSRKAFLDSQDLTAHEEDTG